MFGEVRVVVEPRDLQRAEAERTVGQRLGIVVALAAEAGHLHRDDAGHAPRRGIQRTQMHGLAEAEVVGMKQSEGAVGAHAVRQRVEQRAPHVAAEMTVIDADQQVDLERDMDRLAQGDVVAGHAIAVQRGHRIGGERRIHRQAAFAIDGDEHGVPAAGPAQPGGRALHAVDALGELGVVGRRHRPLLGAEGLRRAPAQLGGRFRRDAAARGQGVRYRHDRRLRGDGVGDGAGADIAVGSVADPVAGRECGAAVRAAAVAVVAEAQAGAAVVLALDDEMGVAAAAVEQVASRRPMLRQRAGAALERDRRQGIGTAPRQRGRGGRGWVERHALAHRHAMRDLPPHHGALVGQRAVREQRPEARRQGLGGGRRAAVGAGRRPGQARCRHHAEVLFEATAVIHQHDVAPGDADAGDRLAAMGLVGDAGDAQREGQGVVVVPGNVGDFGAVERVGAGHHLGQAHGVSMVGVGIASDAGQRAEHLLEDQHVAGGQIRVRAGQRRPGGAGRQAAALVAPGMEVEAVVGLAQGGAMQRLEHQRRRGQRRGFGR